MDAAIRWLVQSPADCPSAGQAAPPGVLSERERARLAALPCAKRRADWLAGRWTAKRLLQAHLLDSGGERHSLDRIVIGSDPDHAPYAALLAESGEVRLPLSLSISHSGGWGFCALAGAPGWAVGADIERVEPRPAGFEEQYFTAAEAAGLAAASAEERPWRETAVWSLKEAVLKALRVGLSVDTRCVSCRLPETSVPPAAWTPAMVTVDWSWLGRTPVDLHAWIRVQVNFVFTLALLKLQPNLLDGEA